MTRRWVRIVRRLRRAWRLVWLVLFAQAAQPAPPTLSATLTPSGVVVLWSASEVVCPWLEYGSVQAYAGGVEPCRASGAALLGYVPDLPARLVLRRPDGSEVTGVELGYFQRLPIVAR
jgi:hypothetical protein